MTAGAVQTYRLLKQYLTLHGQITTAAASRLTGKAATTMRRYLAEFVSLGLLEAHGGNRNRTYSLK